MPNDLDPIEDDWKVARPVRRSPEEIGPQLSEPEDAYVWVVFATREGTHLSPRIRVQVPTNNEPVSQHFRNGWETEELPIFKVDLQGAGLKHPLQVDSMYLFLNRTGHTLIATANLERIPQVLSPTTVWNEFAFIISGPGRLYVLHRLPLTSPDDTVTSWEASPWEREGSIGRQGTPGWQGAQVPQGRFGVQGQVGVQGVQGSVGRAEGMLEGFRRLYGNLVRDPGS
jgi:hypothetical protein